MSLDFDQITENLYLGSKPDHGDWHILAALGVTVNINLMIEQQVFFTGTAPEVQLWLPSADWYGPSVETLHVGVAFIDSMIKLDRNVYVHCFAGVGRSPTLVAGYFVAQGMSVSDSIEFVRSKRAKVGPVEQQIVHLQEFADSFRKNNIKIKFPRFNKR